MILTPRFISATETRLAAADCLMSELMKSMHWWIWAVSKRVKLMSPPGRLGIVDRRLDDELADGYADVRADRLLLAPLGPAAADVSDAH